MITIIRITLMSANMTNKTYRVFALFSVLRFIRINLQHCFLCEIHKLSLQDLRRSKLTHFPIIVKKKAPLTPSPLWGERRDEGGILKDFFEEMC